MYPLEKCQKIKLDQGAIYLGPSDIKQSVGYLELDPFTSLTLHNRPAIEKLIQVKNRSSMVIYDSSGNTDGTIVTLNEGDTLAIEPAGTWHIHVNPYGEPQKLDNGLRSWSQ